MFWDAVAGVYDIFANVINKRVNIALCTEVEKMISSSDKVLECACGTGLLTKVIAKSCKNLVATDFSTNMLKKARKNCKGLNNIEFRQCNILQPEFDNESFDVVVAGNVIHLLDEPYKALSELKRVCVRGGKIILPTYMNKGRNDAFISAMDSAGADFKRQFTFNTYKLFFQEAGYENVEYEYIDGVVPCAIAVIINN